MYSYARNYLMLVTFTSVAQPLEQPCEVKDVFYLANSLLDI